MIAEDSHPAAAGREPQPGSSTTAAAASGWPPGIGAGRAGGGAERAAAVLKPTLRGWLHAGMFPLALAGGIVLVVLARSPGAAVACSVYAASALLLFGTSAVYHRGTWGRRGRRSCGGWTTRTSS